MGATCVLVIGVYAWIAKSGCWELAGVHAGNSYYNLLVQGFRAGQLNVKRQVPPGLSQLADPYDPEANVSYLMQETGPLYDMSYYRGKLYLYFGVTPALVLFWPYYKLTGHYLLHRHAVGIFFSAGFLVSAGLLVALWRRYFSAVGIGVIAACTLALGLASGGLLLLAPCDVYEVAVSCVYALMMLTLALLWRAVHAPREGQVWWLAGASLAYGLALGARPDMLFGAVILLVPVALAWREKAEPGQRRQLWTLLLAATVPIAVIGVGLMLYNYLRFDNPFEFGQRYQLAGSRRAAEQQFSLRYLWVNFRVAFLEPAHWSGRFPFVSDIEAPPLPKGYEVEHPYGVLSCIPLVWLALAVPMAWRHRLAEARPSWRGFLAAVTVLFGISALTLCLHNSMNLRYEVEFLPALVWLAVLGMLGSERVLAGLPVWRHATRCGWGVLLAFSMVFNLCGTFERYTDTHVALGKLFACANKWNEARVQFQKALELQPGNAEARRGLCVVLSEKGQGAEALAQLQEILRFQPADAQANNDLGVALLQIGRVREGMSFFERALRLQPDQVEAHLNLATALLRLGLVPEALGYFDKAIRVKPHCAVETRDSVAVALLQAGRVNEAVGYLEGALRLRPDYAQAHNDLGCAFLQLDRVSNAVDHLEQALHLKPNFGNARNNLAVALVQLGKESASQGKWDEAIRLYRRAIELKPDNVQAHDGLGLALGRQGKFAEALEHSRRALDLDPRWLPGRLDLAWLLATCADEKVRNGARAVELAEGAKRLVGGKDAAVLDTLAAAYAEAGQFGDAVVNAKQAYDLAITNGQKELSVQIKGRLKLYESGRPYREK